MCIYATSHEEERRRGVILFESDSHSYRYDMELAMTEAQKKRGLMFREQLLPQTGMLFYYQKAQKVGIWMKNTRITLDILFITCNDRIEKIIHSRQPGNLIPVFSDNKVCYVAEIAAGDAKNMKLDVGDKVVIKASGVSQ